MKISMETMDVLVMAVMGAAAVGGGMFYFGGRTVRSWAVPIGCAILYGGVGYAFQLPAWLVVLGFLATPIVFHKNPRSRLQASLRACAYVELDGEASTLRAETDLSGKYMGVWTLMPEKDLQIRLEFVGAEDEDFRVLVSSYSENAPKGILSCHTPDSRLGPDPMLAEKEPLSGLPGLTPDIVVRALPEDHGFTLLDIRTLAALSDILSLRTKARDIHVHISGPQMKIESTEVFDSKELETLLIGAATLFKKVRDTGAMTGL
ncbi:MAG: hypothetical protein ABIJ96_16680 [Elusimicrobiota bacterium]